MTMDVKNLIGKLHSHEGSIEVQRPSVPAPRIPVRDPVIEESKVRDMPRLHDMGGKQKMSEDFDGIILDLGEGISLNIPVQRRMSLSDFIKLAEKVKALEMLSEGTEPKHHQY